jgi:alpha-glucosidase
MPAWLKDAVFYEIYPQSFMDSDGDGIGDIKGMASKLEYIRDLGCNALWINPVYDSPFKDAGYDVRDYKKIAPRYGTNEDMYAFFEKAHHLGLMVLMDLVPGHTSDQHAWFKESAKRERNAYSDRYVWTSHAFEGIKDHPYISGMYPREGAYMLNFFVSQPALNYGWGERTEKWMSAVDSKAAIETKEAIKDIMRFWLDHGCDGFRVDMADSLVKNDDEEKHFTAAIWKDVRNMLDEEYPQAALVSEWSHPASAINLAGFHMDFYLDHIGNGYNTLLRDYETGEEDNSFFKSDGKGDIARFLQDYLPQYEKTKENGYISMFTCNHDTPRPARTLTQRELKLFDVFLFTMPGVPFLYYGDEIGMKYLEGLASVEGGYHRTGSRSPMQWDRSKKNFGFSQAEKENLYIRQDASPKAPDVKSQEEDPDSLLNTVKKLIALRHAYEDLQADGSFTPMNPNGHVFVYQRGEIMIAINPSLTNVQFAFPEIRTYQPLFQIGETEIHDQTLLLHSQSAVILK